MRPLAASLVAAALGLALTGCSDGAVPVPHAGLPAQPPQVEPASDDWCPDREHERVHYRGDDLAACATFSLDCTTEQNGFRSACGCGCIDKGDPICPTLVEGSIDWMGIDPSECPAEPPLCPLGQLGFSNVCGCGCASPGAA